MILLSRLNVSMYACACMATDSHKHVNMCVCEEKHILGSKSISNCVHICKSGYVQLWSSTAKDFHHWQVNVITASPYFYISNRFSPQQSFMTHLTMNRYISITCYSENNHWRGKPDGCRQQNQLASSTLGELTAVRQGKNRAIYYSIYS